MDARLLKEYLVKRRMVRETEIPNDLPMLPKIQEKTHVLPPRANAEPTVTYRLSYENLLALQAAVNLLMLKAYSPSTVRTYRGELMAFLQVLGKHSAKELSTEDVKRYLLKCMKEGLSENTMHSRINALKLYYEQALGREKFFLDIPRPKKPSQLPKVLGEQEITRLFNAVTNKKHKAILFTAYSAGLRVSEVVNLKLRDVDSDRMQLFVERAKGKKDRLVTLSPVLLDVFRAYQKGVKISSQLIHGQYFVAFPFRDSPDYSPLFELQIRFKNNNKKHCSQKGKQIKKLIIIKRFLAPEDNCSSLFRT